MIFCCGLAWPWPTLCLVNSTFPTVTSNNANFTLLGQINNIIILHLGWLLDQMPTLKQLNLYFRIIILFNFKFNELFVQNIIPLK